ncbi:ADP-dependent glucokinase/phosphofructokinase [Mobiluncus mulieris]|uniref:ADP-dependent glucokinase n=1 Tax=Mobiluncus mulieris TaxID=2052 RepID=A0A8G2M4M7_9ACTO|nr:ADP-dependent glucokinase/phosphofructokinase [Mobiluncus mulieris]MBB5845840.1 ADP-dependent phosphofructokinase/glucokinase [Mobiluncus mulieris]MCV0009362.1 hypothetical protein [Mobiluncus mulieris]NMW60923.1 hypothetical protein [Mobiluncus mulieris]STO15501.1 ADP-dependent glucokinase [Mobiluncus mulieris]
MRIVLGLTGCVDYEICWDSTVLQGLVTDMKLRVGELVRPSSISSIRDLVISILWYMEHGIGGEEYVISKNNLLEFADCFTYKVTLGGTAVRAGIALAKMGVGSIVHAVSSNPVFNNLIPDNIKLMCCENSNYADPHLIIQYPSDVEIVLADGCIRSKRPNRLIYVNDEPNALVTISPLLSDALRSADIFLISGINGIRDKVIIDKKCDEIALLSRNANPNMICVYEEAAFHVDSFKYDINSTLSGIIDIRSMNEDEAQKYLNLSINLYNPEEIIEMFTGLSRLFPNEVIVVHTQNWVAASGVSPKISANQIKEALSKGVYLASTRFLYGDDLDVNKYLYIKKQPYVYRAQILMDKLASSQIFGIPSIDINANYPTTIGLGDSFCGGLVWGLSELLEKDI